MALTLFFKLPKTKSFHYRPRYYDERKEELEKRIAQIKKEMGITDETDMAKEIEKTYSVDIKGKMRSRFRPNRRKESRKSTIRLMFILAALMFLAYLLIYH